MWCQNVGSMFFRFVTKQVSDGRTDRQKYDLQDRTSMAASHGKNVTNKLYTVATAVCVNLPAGNICRTVPRLQQLQAQPTISTMNVHSPAAHPW